MIRWEDTGEQITTEQQLIDHPTRRVEVLDEHGRITDRYRPCNLGAAMLPPARK